MLWYRSPLLALTGRIPLSRRSDGRFSCSASIEQPASSYGIFGYSNPNGFPEQISRVANYRPNIPKSAHKSDFVLTQLPN